MKLYARLGVREYCIFDPLRDYLIPQIRLYRLSQGEYLPVTGEPLHLTTVGLDLEIAENVLRLRVPGSETYLPTIKDEEARADAEKARADEERRRDGQGGETGSKARTIGYRLGVKTVFAHLEDSLWILANMTSMWLGGPS